MKHLKYHDRVLIKFEISENPESTLRSVAEKLGVSRSTVMREIIRNSTVTKACSPVSLRGTPKQAPECPKLRKWPYCRDRCAKTRCHLARLHYRAGEAERTSSGSLPLPGQELACYRVAQPRPLVLYAYAEPYAERSRGEAVLESAAVYFAQFGQPLSLFSYIL